MINRSEAKAKIKEIVSGAPLKTGLTLPTFPGKAFNVYQIPLDYLIPNILNDRISMKVREFEAEQGRKLSNETEADIEYVYRCIEEMSEKENKATEEDIAKKGQQVDGVITNEGIIIDGNRRETLIRKLYEGDASKFGHSVDEFKYFNAIVLPGDVSEKDIMSLETRLQIGEDEKVGYNAICIYIKVDNLEKAGFSPIQIKDFMHRDLSEVKEKEEVFKLMNEYLDYIGKPDHYTLLDGLEDQFISTKNVFKKLDNGTYRTANNWDYEDSIPDFKAVCFDYMRAGFEGKKYRDVLVGKPNKSNGVFIDQNVWQDFKKHHEEIIQSNNPQSEDDWKRLGKKQFAENLSNASNELRETLNNKNVDGLVRELKGKLNNLKTALSNNPNQTISEEALNDLKEISKEIYSITKDYK